MEERLKKIKSKIFDIIEKRLSSDISALDLQTYHNIIHNEEADFMKMYSDMIKAFKPKEKDDELPKNS